MSVPPDCIGGFFPLTAIRSLAFRDDTLEETKPISKGPGDTAKVVIVPKAIGEYIAGLDTQEEVFHVETFPSHSELWLAIEWRESNRRRDKLREFLSAERAEREKRNHRIERIKALLPLQGGDAWNSRLAELALSEYKNGNMDKVLAVLNLSSVLKEFEEEDRNERMQ